MKRLFRDNDERYSPEALKLLSEITKVVKPIMKAYAESGYSIRDISHAAQAAITDFESEYILTTQVKKAKDKRNALNDFNADGVKYQVKKDGKIITTYIGNGKRNRFIPLLPNLPFSVEINN